MKSHNQNCEGNDYWCKRVAHIRLRVPEVLDRCQHSLLLLYFWDRRLTARTAGFHPANEGSTPFGPIKHFNAVEKSYFNFCSLMVKQFSVKESFAGSSPAESDLSLFLFFLKCFLCISKVWCIGFKSLLIPKRLSELSTRTIR